MISLSTFEDPKENHRLVTLMAEVSKELQDLKVNVKVDVREDEIMLHALRNVYKFLEIHQQ